MAGSSSVRGDQTIYHTDNMCFDGTDRGSPMALDGQLWIGATASNRADNGGHVRLGSLTSPAGTITIGYSAPNITLDLAGGSLGIDSIAVDTTTGAGTNPVVPTAAGLVTFTGGQYPTGTFGTRVVDINSSAANTLQVLLQQTSAVAASDSTKNGIAHFNSAEFSVDANGFVSIKSAGFIWTDVTSATQTLAVENGYLTDRGAGVTYTLPATASIGDTIKIVGKLGLTTVAQNANQAIRMSSALSTTGVSGSIAGTNVGDCVTLVCTTSGASTIWAAESFVGNWTVT